MAAVRLASLAYALLSGLYYLQAGRYERPGLAVGVLAAMVVWTAAVTVLRAEPHRRTAGLLVADTAVAVALLLSGRLVQYPSEIALQNQPTLTLSWGAVPVVAWAVLRGPVAGGIAALVMSAATVAWRGALTRPTLGSCVLLLLLGVVVGYVVALARRAESAYAQVVQREAAQAERERLARSVHDGVLQALALVGRRSADRELAELAREQERALRRLVAGPAPLPTGELDLRSLLPGGADVEVAAPAEPVRLPAHAARELAAAVHACVDNVRRHAGGRAWLLVEDDSGAVTVSVRDAGPGMRAGRLEQAEREGRLGVARSVRGRVSELGGTVDVVSAPGAGTEVELRVPRA